jgi:hypothetical protein
VQSQGIRRSASRLDDASERKKKAHSQDLFLSYDASEEAVKILLVWYLASTFIKIPAPGKGNGSAVATIHNLGAWL